MKTTVLQNRTGFLAGILVIAGILLFAFVAKSLLIVAALGAFGPGVLRELGWLRDHDEFQRRAAHRAGYHAYLLLGLILATLASILSLEGQSVDDPSELLLSVLVILWMAWMFSSLLSFWGARKTASRLLLVFGAFWAMFIIASLVGENAGSDVSFREGALGVAFGASLIGAFFLPAWTALRWPRATGIVLVVIATALLALLHSGGRGEALQWTTILITDSLLLLPLYVCGIALIRHRLESD